MQKQQLEESMERNSAGGKKELPITEQQRMVREVRRLLREAGLRIQEEPQMWPCHKENNGN